MLKNLIWQTSGIAVRLWIVLSLMTGLAYTVAVTGIAKIFFPQQAQGSLIFKQQQLIGSQLIGQFFSRPEYFWGRPSGTLGHPYNSLNSNGFNLAPSDPSYLNLVLQRIEALQQSDPDAPAAIPADLLMASASGLDPEISLAAAYYQVPRIAKARKLPINTIQDLIKAAAIYPKFGIWGPARVRVLPLNLALDQLQERQGIQHGRK